MNCQHCLTPMAEHAKFCGNCGAAAGTKPAQQPQWQGTCLAWQPIPVRRPLYKRAWFWLLLVLGVPALLIVGFLGLSLLISESHVEYEPAQPGDHALVGRWDWDLGGSYAYIFRADGTGSRGFRWFVMQFEWHVSPQGDLILEMLATDSTRRYHLTMLYDRFTIRNHESGEVYTYIRRSPVVNPPEWGGNWGANVAPVWN